MKKIFLSSLMLLCAMVVFTACNDDNDSNPTLVQPSTFVLNESPLNKVDLSYSNAIPLTWSQPDYGGWPAAVTYQLEVSTTNTWTISTEQADADETGEIFANYATLATIYTAAKGDMSVDELATALQKICQWPEDSVPNEQTVYVRCKATTNGAADVYSNVITFVVNPYYVELKDAAIELWYLVGAEIGTVSWGNTADGVGTGLQPLYPVEGNEYDKKTGQGELKYIGYFHAGAGFKLIKTPGNWDAQWGIKDGVYVRDDGGSGDITVDKDGYYTIILNTATNELSITPYDGDPIVCGTISMPGDYQATAWDVTSNLMDDVFDPTVVENHDWFVGFFTVSDCQLKFAANGSWDINWGSASFPYGLGTQGGANIPVEAGTYNVFFNDILGYYNFIEIW